MGSGLYTSTNAGVTWVGPAANTSGMPWISVASDSTGTRLVAVQFAPFNGGPGPGIGDIWTSQDSGVTWTDQTTAGNACSYQAWWSVTSDATGTNLVAATSPAGGAAQGYGFPSWSGPGMLAQSHDSGATWSIVPAPSIPPLLTGSNQQWGGLASSADGQHVVAVATGGDVWTYAPPTNTTSLTGQCGAAAHLIYEGNGSFFLSGWAGQLSAR